MNLKTLLMLALLIAGKAACAAADGPFRIDLQLPVLEDVGNYERPYVAVWVATEKNKSLKVLGLWYQDEGERWLKDLKFFWRRVLRSNDQAADGVTGATRGPGHHTLWWDGTDQQGQPLATGRYKLCTEVAREHGGRNAKCLSFNYPLEGSEQELRLNGEFTLLRIKGEHQ